MKLWPALLAMLACAAPAQAAERPFDDGWRFTRIDGAAPDRPPADAKWVKISLPHSARIEPRVVNDQWQGIAFYSKRFEAPANSKGGIVLLRFEGAMNVAAVWLNGTQVAQHLGGYLPFTMTLRGT